MTKFIFASLLAGMFSLALAPGVASAQERGPGAPVIHDHAEHHARHHHERKHHHAARRHRRHHDEHPHP